MGLNNYFDREKNTANTSYLKRKFGISESASEDIIKEAKVRRSEVGTTPSLGMKSYGSIAMADASSAMEDEDDTPSFLQYALDTISKATKTRNKGFKKVDLDPESGTVMTERMDKMQGPMQPPTAEQTSDKYAPTRVGGYNDQQAFKKLVKAHPALGKDDKVAKIIKGESAGKTAAFNEGSGASGLFQLTTPALTDLKELGYVDKSLTLKQVRGMSRPEQLELYSKYLTRWGYDGSQSLGVLQAAPGFRNAPMDTVIYKKGSKEWDQNPGWRPSDGGDITGNSIDLYYFGAPKTPRPRIRPFVEKKA